MPAVIVVNKPKNWPLSIPGVEVISAKSYLTDRRYLDERHLRVFNLCKDYRYQSSGYYVSLLATARGHKPIPSIATLQDMKSSTVARTLAEDLDELVQESLKDIRSREFVLSIYFGKNVAKKYDRLALRIFNMFEAPFLRATFCHGERWELRQIETIAASDVPENHHEFVINRAIEYFTRTRPRTPEKKYRYDLAILHEPGEENPPSDERALKRFMKAAESLSIDTELITRDDYGRIAEYDALFIRVTTRVNHYTYRFARRAEAEGLVVIDDSESIIKCSNKVYLAEALHRIGVPTPRTLVVHRDNLPFVKNALRFPCVLKIPDSAFSQGVIKVETYQSLLESAEEFFKKSELFVAQEFVPTDFDWRIGVLDGRPLFACKYFMARAHWQIIRKDGEKNFAGKVETLDIGDVPPHIIEYALKATSTMGKGFYGVDIKQAGNRSYVIEVNDNPNVDAGYEDSVLKDDLYLEIMRVFLQRMEGIKEEASRHEPIKSPAFI